MAPAGRGRREFRCSTTIWVLLAVLAGCAPIAVLTMIAPDHPGIGLFAGSADLRVYRDGASRVASGLPLYAGPILYGHQYTYPPFSTLAFQPLRMLPGGALDRLWLCGNIGLLFGCVMACWRLLGYRWSRPLLVIGGLLTSAALFLEPVRTTLFYGQINLLLLALILFDAGRVERSWLRGVGTGLAAGIKLTPLYFVGYAAALRQWRAVLVAVGTFAGTVTATWLVIPGTSRQFWTDRVFHANRVGFDAHPANQSLRGAYAHLTGHTMPAWLWLVLAAVIALANLTIAVRLARAGEGLLALTSVGLGAAVVSPFTWSHHWVWFVPLLVYLVHRAATDPCWGLAVLALFVVAGSWVWYYPQDYPTVGLFMFPPWWPWPVRGVLLNVYLWTFVVIESWLGWSVRRSARSPAARAIAADPHAAR